jgi:hypothetical protein
MARLPKRSLKEAAKGPPLPKLRRPKPRFRQSAKDAALEAQEGALDEMDRIRERQKRLGRIA